jgi:hypothetical protein
MSIARQYHQMQAKKRQNGHHPQAKGADLLVEARAQVKALEAKVRAKEDEIARLHRELIKKKGA